MAQKDPRGSAKVACALAVFSFFVLNPRWVHAQAQSPDQQACINAVNKGTGKVASTQGKENTACVKAVVKGSGSMSCLTADSKGKVGKAKTKTTSDETSRCSTAPDFAYTSGATGNTAAQDAELALFSGVYGGVDPTAVISADPVIGGCQAAATKALEKVVATRWKEFNKCKKTALKAGADDIADVEACVVGTAKTSAAVGKLTAALSKSCATVTVGTTFPGGCAASPLGTLGDCLDALGACQFCQAVNAIDDMAVDCDLFDDTTANGSCGIQLQVCNLDTTSFATSGIDVVFGDPSSLLSFAMSGSVLVGGYANQSACAIQSINPIDVFGLGWLCITPGTQTCETGTRFCGVGAGPALGVAVDSDGNVGACLTEAACETTCATACSGAENVVVAGCTGHCSGGTEQACTNDSDCETVANGNCNGPEPVGTADVCQCTCADRAAYGPSAAGDYQCDVSARIVIEASPGVGAPCDGTEVLVDVGDVCIPFSTLRASGLMVEANGGGDTVPTPSTLNDNTGVAISCGDVEAGNLTGLMGVGAMNFFGSSLGGDLSAALRFTCQ